MLDQNVLNSVLSSGAVGKTESRKAEKEDGDAFSAALGEASKDKESKSKDTKASKAEAREKEARKLEARDQEDKQKAAAQAKTPTSSVQMQKLMKKNVDTLSLSEKQALRVAEFANEAEQQARKSVSAAPPQAQAQTQPGAATAKGQRSTPGEVAARGASSLARPGLEAERVDEKTRKAVEELQSREQPKGGAGNLDQLLARESKFAEEMQKTGQVERAQERQSVIDQIMQQIEVRNFANRTELNFKLNPEYLGELSVKLVHSDDGVRADFETSSKRTRDLLREGEEDLRTQAGQKGVRLKAMRFTVVDSVQGAG